MGCSKDQSPGHTTARTHPAAPWKEKACILVPIAGSACAGTTLRYRPGLITGGSGLTHDCGKARGMGYFLEPLVCMALFGKKVRIASHCTDYVCFGNTCCTTPLPWQCLFKPSMCCGQRTRLAKEARVYACDLSQ